MTEHCYFPKTVHLPRDLGYYRMITRKRKELGFNFVRFHTFVPPVEYLEATDELGMLVEMESPNFVTEAEYAAILAFARRHPSVVLYSTGNETRIDRLAEVYLREIADMVHDRTDALFSPMSALRAVEYALRYNGPAVLLADFRSDFVFAEGTTRPTALSVSNFAAPAKDATLEVRLVDAADGRTVLARTVSIPFVPAGVNTALATVPVAFPKTGAARSYRLVATFASAAFTADNVWKCYAFPTDPAIVDVRPSTALRVVTDISRDDLLAAMAKGETVVLFGRGPFKTSPMTHCTGRAGRCSGNFATVVKKGHPALAGFPNDGFCGWSFRRLMERSCVVQVEGPVPFDPIIDVASSVKCPIRQAALAEYRVGAGRLIFCTFNFQKRDPAAGFLKSRILAYADSPAFLPGDVLTVGQLAAWLDTPAVKTTGNPNRALNPGDPSSYVRVREDLMP